jgi:hypothetical protein
MACGVACHRLGIFDEKVSELSLFFPRYKAKKSAAHLASVKKPLEKSWPGPEVKPPTPGPGLFQGSNDLAL